MRRIEIYGNKIIDRKRNLILAYKNPEYGNFHIFGFHWMDLEKDSAKIFFNYLNCRGKTEFRKKIRQSCFSFRFLNYPPKNSFNLWHFPIVDNSLKHKPCYFIKDRCYYVFYKGYFIAKKNYPSKKIILNKMYWDNNKIIRNYVLDMIGMKNKKPKKVAEYFRKNAYVLLEGSEVVRVPGVSFLTSASFCEKGNYLF